MFGASNVRWGLVSHRSAFFMLISQMRKKPIQTIEFLTGKHRYKRQDRTCNSFSAQQPSRDDIAYIGRVRIFTQLPHQQVDQPTNENRR
jgi:hypothetical protein